MRKKRESITQEKKQRSGLINIRKRIARNNIGNMLKTGEDAQKRNEVQRFKVQKYRIGICAKVAFLDAN